MKHARNKGILVLLCVLLSVLICSSAMAVLNDNNLGYVFKFENNITNDVGANATNSGVAFNSTVFRNGSYSGSFDGTDYWDTNYDVFTQGGNPSFTAEGWFRPFETCPADARTLISNRYNDPTDY